MSSKPRILLYDIETAPIRANVWKIWQENVGTNQIIRDWCVIAWAAKWLDDPESEIRYRDQRGKRRVEDDKEILKELYDMMADADIVVTFNGKRFDQRKVNTRFLIHDLKPTRPTKHEDVFQFVRRTFGFTSNKLEYIAEVLKTPHQKYKSVKFPGFLLWEEAVDMRNMEAWEEMEIYNKQDVMVLEDVYRLVRPWMPNHYAVHQDEHQCKCGSKNLEKRGFAYTPLRKYQQYRCRDCGHWTRDTHADRCVSRAGVTR